MGPARPLLDDLLVRLRENALRGRLLTRRLLRYLITLSPIGADLCSSFYNGRPALSQSTAEFLC